MLIDRRPTMRFGAPTGRAPDALLRLIILGATALAACESPRPTQPERASSEALLDRSSALAASPAVVLASGLRYPRGLTFDDHGNIYVAEAGTPAGHAQSTVGQCAQVPAPQGPHRGGATGRISRIDASGIRTTVASGLPSSASPRGGIIGITDLAFIDERLYALVNGGCSQGLPTAPASVIRVDPSGSWTVAADLSAWIASHPVARPNAGDLEPDGDWYSMVAAGGVLYAVEANQGQLVSVHPTSGRVARVVDVSTVEGHAVPTAVTVSRDMLLVGELTTFPAVPGGAKVLRYRRDGRPAGALSGFTAILGVDADRHGNVYVLESFTCATTAPCFPSPRSGRVVRVASDGARSVVAAGLSFATTVRLGPDGALYISNFGYGPPSAGQILRVALGSETADADDHDDR